MQVIPLQNTVTDKVKKVAAYCRVSTDKEVQRSSYESQVEYYTSKINSRKEWEFAGVYADLGKSGLKASKRPEFLRMIEDAKAGKIDVILVKNISRFARNSLEAQEFVHILKEYDVEVIFEENDISSFDPHTEVMFDIRTAIAEEESRIMAKNIRESNRKLAEKGIRLLGNNRVIGYDEIDGVLTPNEKAWIPELIFTRFAEGKSYRCIADELEEKGAERMKSSGRYTASTINNILKNEIYVGDRLIQKTPPVDYLTGKPVKGEDYISYYVEDDHKGVVERDVWDTVQRRLGELKDLRDKGIHRTSRSHFLFGRIFCGECGEPMIRRIRSYNGDDKISWICRDRRKGKKGKGCKNLIVPENELMEAVCSAVGKEWRGMDDVGEEMFEELGDVRIFGDGNIEVEKITAQN